MQHTEARSPLTAGHASAGTGEYEEQNGTAKEQYGVDAVSYTHLTLPTTERV